MFLEEVVSFVANSGEVMKDELLKEFSDCDIERILREAEVKGFLFRRTRDDKVVYCA